MGTRGAWDMGKTSRLACALLLFAFAPGVTGAGAATLSVPGQYPTIQEAVNHAAAGDTVQVAEGTFHEKLYIIGRSRLTIAGAGRTLTKVVNRYVPGNDVPAVYVSDSGGIRISGIGFAGGFTGLVVTADSSMTLEDSSITGFHDLGAFVGAIGCAPLPAGSLRVPQCYLEDPAAYVDSSSLEVYGSVVSNNGVRGECGTGLVFFPGSTGLIQGSTVNANKLTGLFVWGAWVDVASTRFLRNVENAVEYRRYPSPKTVNGLALRASGLLSGNRLSASLPLPGGSLGGGLVAQGADLELRGNVVTGNAAWGVTACRDSQLIMEGNEIAGNRKSGLIIQKRTRATLGPGNVLRNNGHEGLVAQGGSWFEAESPVIRGNGGFGVLLQKNSEGRLLGALIEENGTRGLYRGGVMFAGRSWGSVTGSTVRNHPYGAGIHFFGGAGELTVEGNDISGNGRSGVVFEGSDALGTLVGNTFGAFNSPYDVSCPGGGSPVLAGQEGGSIDPRCLAP